MQEGVKKVTPQRQDKVGDCPACQAQEPLEAIAPPLCCAPIHTLQGPGADKEDENKTFTDTRDNATQDA